MRTLRALPTLLRVGLAESIAYRAELLVWLLTTTMPLVALALWSAVGADGPMGGYGQADLISYFLAALVVRQVSGSWLVWELTWAIRTGQLAPRMLRPVHPLVAFAASGLAPVPLRWLTCLPVIVLFQRDEVRHLAAHPGALAAFAASLAIAWCINFFVMVAIGSLAFFVDSAQSVYQAWAVLFMVLSGYLVPLSLFPPWAARLADALPLRHTLAVPVALATGRLSGAAAWAELAQGAAWAAAACGAGLLVWWRGVRRFEAFGG